MVEILKSLKSKHHRPPVGFGPLAGPDQSMPGAHLVGGRENPYADMFVPDNVAGIVQGARPVGFVNIHASVEEIIEQTLTQGTTPILEDLTAQFKDVVNVAIHSSFFIARDMPVPQRGIQKLARKMGKTVEQIMTEVPLSVSIKLLGRTGKIKDISDMVVDLVGFGGTSSSVEAIRNEIKEVWWTRLDREKTFRESRESSLFTVEAKLKNKDVEVLDSFWELGFDPALVVQAKMLELQIYAGVQASIMFESLYFDTYKERFDHKMVQKNPERIDEILHQFHNFTPEKIDALLVKNQTRLQQFNTKSGRDLSRERFEKDDYLMIFKHSLRDGKLDVVDLSVDRTYVFNYEGQQFTGRWHDARSKELPSFSEILINMDLARKNAETGIRNMIREFGIHGYIGARQLFDEVYAGLKENRKLLQSGNEKKLRHFISTKLTKDIEPNMRNHILDEIASSFNAIANADFVISIGAMDTSVHHGYPTNIEMHAGFGRVTQIDISRPSDEQNIHLAWNQGSNQLRDKPNSLMVYKKSVHKALDGIHAMNNIDHLLERSMHELTDLKNDIGIQLDTPAYRDFQMVLSLIGGQDRYEAMRNYQSTGKLETINLGWRHDKKTSLTVFAPTESRPEFYFRRFSLQTRALSGHKKQNELFEDALKATEHTRKLTALENLDHMAKEGDWKGVISAQYTEELYQLNHMLVLQAQEVFSRRWQAVVQKKNVLDMTPMAIHKMRVALFEQVTQVINQKNAPKYHELAEKFIASTKEFTQRSVLVTEAEKNFQFREQLVQERKANPGDYYRDDYMDAWLNKLGLNRTLKDEIEKCRDRAVFLLNERVTESLFDQYQKDRIGQHTTFSVVTLGMLVNFMRHERFVPVVHGLTALADANRLEPFYVAADKGLSASVSKLVSVTNKKDVDLSEVEKYWSLFMKRAMITSGIVNRFEVKQAERLLGNIQLITAGSGDIREKLLVATTRILNPNVDSQYHSPGMNSSIRRQNSRVSAFHTVKTSHNRSVVGIVNQADDGELNVWASGRAQHYLKMVEKRFGTTFETARPEVRQKMKEDIEKDVDRDVISLQKDILLTFALLSYDTETLVTYAGMWNAIAEKRAQYKNSFLNCLVWTAMQERGMSFELLEREYDYAHDAPFPQRYRLKDKQ